MAYDPYRPEVTDDWTLMAQIAIWRERAVHQAARAEHYRALAEAVRNGTPFHSPATAVTSTKAGN